MHSAMSLSLVSAALLVAAPAAAQKSRDTVRIAINDPFPTLLQYHHPVDEATNFSKRVYEQLIYRDEYNNKFIGQLAKSFKRVDDTTLEFDLRDDKVFHNGNKLDADDVVTTINYVKDPKVPLQFKFRWTWIDRVEKLGQYKVRIVAKQPSAMDLPLIAYMIPILDSETFGKLDNKADYGRLSPNGTGPYKVTMLDTNKGTIVERFDGFKGDKNLFPSNVKTVHAVPVPDPQTRVAKLIAGELEMIRAVTPDDAREIDKMPALATTVVPTGYFVFFGLDSAGRSKNKALKDIRVRTAIWQAIDRNTIIKHIVPGGDKGIAKPMNGLCFDFNIGCKATKEPLPYDPAAAKRLLTEAGYANGFDLEYDCFTPIKYICEAVAGELRKVNIRTTVLSSTIQVYRQHQSAGEQQAFSVFYPTPVLPDAGAILGVFFEGERDYHRDDKMTAWQGMAAKELDPDKRAAILEQALNHSTEMIYTMALTSYPTIYAHTKDLEIRKDPLVAGDTYINDYAWK